jgi:hypothetical protein
MEEGYKGINQEFAIAYISLPTNAISRRTPFKAWVDGSSPSALTKFLKRLDDYGRIDSGQPQTPGTSKNRLPTR